MTSSKHDCKPKKIPIINLADTERVHWVRLHNACSFTTILNLSGHNWVAWIFFKERKSNLCYLPRAHHCRTLAIINPPICQNPNKISGQYISRPRHIIVINPQSPFPPRIFESNKQASQTNELIIQAKVININQPESRKEVDDTHILKP